MCDSYLSGDENSDLEDVDNELQKSNKAIISEQQKYADDILFLRYLELDPTEGPEAIPAATQRKATGNKYGRTPFTQTKKLVSMNKGFGLSLVWTHPPRIERVDKGQAGEKAGILPGDYLIFVDKYNVVMMPEFEILNLIRSCGSQLTIEIFRKSSPRNGSVPSMKRLNSTTTGTGSSVAGLPVSTALVQRRPSTICSTTYTTSIDTRRKLHLPQVKFNPEKLGSEDNRKKIMYQLIRKEQQYVTELQFAISRFVSALAERKDLITALEHKVLFQNSEEILRISEDILEHVHEDGEPHTQLLINIYHIKLYEIMSAYKKYCSGIKKADCVLVNKTKNCNSEFVRFLQVPTIPKRRPDITSFIHKPLEHYREILKLLTTIQNLTEARHSDYPLIQQIVYNLQMTYKEITSKAGLMEPVGNGKPLLTVQDLENRLVFTKCKPFVLNKPGREWLFGGDLNRVEGRNVKSTWTLLFSDILLFAKVSRDRVLFIIEEPLNLANISDLNFNVKKKDTEFRITTSPEDCRKVSSPTVRCGPDLSVAQKKSSSKKTIVLRAPTIEMKAVWQNLLQKQLLQIASSIDGSSYSSPLESPDVPITSSVVTLQSAETLSCRRQNTLVVNNKETSDMQRQLDAFIEHKCIQMSKDNHNNKYNALHLERWIKCQLNNGNNNSPDLEPLSEEWTEDMLRKRSEELQLIHSKNNIGDNKKSEIKIGENLTYDHDKSPSKSTTESQVTVRSTPYVSLPETVKVCRQCHKNCLSAINGNRNSSKCSDILNDSGNIRNNSDIWHSIMDLYSPNSVPDISNIDPFSAVVVNHTSKFDENKSCYDNCTGINNIVNARDVDFSPDDSPETDDHPYHSLSGSAVTLRRFGTVSSLERVGSEDQVNRASSDSDDNEPTDVRTNENSVFSDSKIKNWTMKAGSFVAEQIAFLEKFGEDYRTSNFFGRYLNISINGEDVPEEETSGATSGEEIWGTPTSGEESNNSPSYEEKLSPNEGSNDNDTEIMMDELLMTPAHTATAIRGLLPIRTLEPLIEEDCSDSSSSLASPTEKSVSQDEDSSRS